MGREIGGGDDAGWWVGGALLRVLVDKSFQTGQFFLV